MVVRKKFDLTRSGLFYFFVIMPFLQPANYVFPDIVNNLLDVWKLAAMALILFIFLLRGKLSPFMTAAVLFQLVIPVSTYLNPLSHGAEMKDAFTFACTNIAVLMAAEIGLKLQPLKFIRAVAYYGGAMCLITAATMFIYRTKGGMDQKQYMDVLGDVNFYFLGHDNRSYFIFIVIQFYVIILSLIRYGKLSKFAWAFNVIVTAAFFYVRSAFAMVCLVLIWIYLLFFLNNKGRIMNFKVYFTAFFLFEILIVFMNITSLFSFLITDIFHKSITMSGRTIIWAKAKSYILKSLFIGYGREPMSVLLVKFGINHVHNILLEILYTQGITGLVLYAAMIYMCGKKLMKYKSNKIAAAVSFIFFSFFICSIFDFYNTIPYIMLLYSFAANIETIINISPQYKESETKTINGENYVTNPKLT